MLEVATVTATLRCRVPSLTSIVHAPAACGVTVKVPLASTAPTVATTGGGLVPVGVQTDAVNVPVKNALLMVTF